MVRLLPMGDCWLAGSSGVTPEPVWPAIDGRWNGESWRLERAEDFGRAVPTSRAPGLPERAFYEPGHR